jgi:hypothetical protein
MPMTDSVFRTISCDGPKCDKVEVMEANSSNPEDQVRIKAAVDKKVAETPWLQAPRVVQAAGKVFLFCSDTCLVNAATAGMFIPAEEKKIISPEGNINAQIKAALEAKLREKAADAALRSGAPVQISQKQA